MKGIAFGSSSSSILQGDFEDEDEDENAEEDALIIRIPLVKNVWVAAIHLCLCDAARIILMAWRLNI